MDESVRDVLERGREAFVAPAGVLDEIMLRRDRRRRNRQLGAGIVALAATVVVAFLLREVLPLGREPLPAAPPPWSAGYMVWGHDSTAPVAVLGDGVYVAGNTYDPADPGHSTAFLRRYDPGGDVDWTRTIGQSGPPNSSGAFALAAADAVYVGGYLRGTGQAFVAAYDPDGTQRWNTTFTTENDQGPTSGVYSLAVGSDGVYAAGDDAEGVFLMKLDFDGGIVWRRDLGRRSSSYLPSVATDTSGVYVGATAYGPVPGETWRSPKRTSAIAILKYGFDGALRWSTEYAGPAGLDGAVQCRLYSIASDGSSLFVAGTAWIRAGRWVPFLQRLDPGGQETWSVQGVPYGSIGASIAADRGLVYMAGLQGPERPGKSDGHVVLDVYDAAGNLVARHEIASIRTPAGSESEYGVAVDPGGVFVNVEWGLHGDTLIKPYPGWSALLLAEAPPARG